MHAGRAVVIAGLAVALGGCGSDMGGGGSERAAPPKVPPVKQFPKVKGRTLSELAQDLQRGPVLAPSVTLLTPGTNRFGFGLFDRARRQIGDAPAALYVAKTPDSRARGPYVARWESLEVKDRWRSKTASSDPKTANTLYVADLPFKAPGSYVVLGLFRLDNRLVGADTRVEVVKAARTPGVGDRAPVVHTPTKADVGGDLSQIDTRDPPSDMHAVDFADVVGRKPVVLIFAAPALCRSRVCGPAVDIAEQVAHSAEYDDAGVAWIQMEVFNDNDPDAGYRPQVQRWRLPSDQWLFTIGRDGRVKAALEGAFSARELEKAVRAAIER